mmetsp:Transcript_72330/g.215848  ORF Transcript_72330/g.215848 Transcript_72330/m.215848 type:complete len:214 (-) Transcript_72330:285-926(-)
MASGTTLPRRAAPPSASMPASAGCSGASRSRRLPSLPRVGQVQLHLRRHREPLQALHGHARLILVLVVHEGDVPAGNQADLLEAGVLPEEHREHGVGGLRGKVLDEERPVGLGHALRPHRGLGCVGRLLRIPADAVLDALLRGRRGRRLLRLLRHRRWCRCSSSARLPLSQVLALHDLLRPLHIRAVGLRNHVRLGPGVVDTHRLVVEGEALQ